MRAYRGIAAALAAVLLAACATRPAERTRVEHGADLEARAIAVLERRGLGADALGVIDNFVRHQDRRPAAAPPSVRDILARPFAAADAEGLFQGSIPSSLIALVEALRLPAATPAGPAMDPRAFLAPHLEALAAAQRELRAAVKGEVPAPAAVQEHLRRDLPRAHVLPLLQAADQARFARAGDLFLEAMAALVLAVREAGPGLRYPDAPLRYDSPIGPVVIGTRGKDRHAAGAALILDPGGDDFYERAPLAAGGMAVVLDLAGDDRYEGDDLAVLAFSALVDFAGDDRHIATGPAQGAAFGGISLLIDIAGDDNYWAGSYAQGAGTLGLGALVDLAGRDRYEIYSGGQGFGMTAGTGLLWDLGGDDGYHATGYLDPYDRGGGLSFAQGSGLGLRASVGGGLGILRDDAGNDRYNAHMFAQGGAYYYGTGLLWDRGGDDRYAAVRYAQGSGTHEAVGVLRDESGGDRYELEVGVGQGMGLDLSVGLLLDLEGEDEFRAPSLAQGSGTANGVGIIAALGARSRFVMGEGALGWGYADSERSLPTLGLMLYEERRATFEHPGKPAALNAGHALLGGPRGGEPARHITQPLPACPAEASPAGNAPLAARLRALLPGLIASRGDAALFASVRRDLVTDPDAALASLPAGDFNVSYALGESLRCALQGSSAAERATLWDAIERHLAKVEAPFLAPALAALRAQPAPAAQMRRMLRPLAQHPSCSVRATALELGDSADEAKAALGDPCWRVKAVAVAQLERLGAAPDPAAPLPSFLEPQRMRLLRSGPGTSPPR